MVPTPDKLIKMLIKSRAVSYLGLPAEIGFSLTGERGWDDEGDARALSDNRGVCAQGKMAKQQRSQGWDREERKPGSFTPKHQFPRQIIVYQPRTQAE